MSKEAHTELLRKFIKDYHSKPPAPAAVPETNRPASTSSDNNQQLLQ